MTVMPGDKSTRLCRLFELQTDRTSPHFIYLTFETLITPAIST